MVAFEDGIERVNTSGGNDKFVDIVSFSYRNELALLPIHFVICRYAFSPLLLRSSLGRADSQKLKKAKQQSSNSIAQNREGNIFSRERHSASLSGAKKANTSQRQA